MPTPFKVTVRLNIPREHLWRVRASRTFMGYLVSHGALKRMDATKVMPLEGEGKPDTERTRKQTYVPGDVEIPEMISYLVDDSYIEICDQQTWDEAHPYIQHSKINPVLFGDVVTTTATLSLEEYYPENTDDPSQGVDNSNTDATSSARNNVDVVANSNAPRPPTTTASSTLEQPAEYIVNNDMATKADVNVNGLANVNNRGVDEGDLSVNNKSNGGENVNDIELSSCWHTVSGTVTVTVPFVGYYVEQAVISNMQQFYARYPDHIDGFVDMVINEFGDGTKASLSAAVDRLLENEEKQP